FRSLADRVAAAAHAEAEGRNREDAGNLSKMEAEHNRSVALPLDDSRRDEDQQLVVLVVREVVLEQPPEERHFVQRRGPALTRFLRAEVDAANDRGLPITHETGGIGAWGVDRGEG